MLIAIIYNLYILAIVILLSGSINIGLVVGSYIVSIEALFLVLLIILSAILL